MILSAAALVGYTVGCFKLKDLETWVYQCKTTMNYGWAPHAEILPFLSILFAGVAGLVLFGLIMILVKPWLFFGISDEPPLNECVPDRPKVVKP
jgi:hypothetical protein